MKRPDAVACTGTHNPSAAPTLPPAAGHVASSTAAGGAPRIVGIDLSLRSTGVASTLGWTATVPTTGKRGDDLETRWVRLKAIMIGVREAAKSADLVVIEQPAYSRVGGSGHDRSGAWWLIIDGLIRAGIPVAEVAPTARAKYATGAGNADKDRVLAAAVRRYPAFDIDGNDVADAVVLAAMGADRLGHPLAPVPETHRAALTKVAWPDLTALETP